MEYTHDSSKGMKSNPNSQWTEWLSQFLWGGGGEGGEIFYLKIGSAIFDPRLESVSSDFIVGSESAKNDLILGCSA